MNTLDMDEIRRIAGQYGLGFAANGDREFSLLFVGEKANETVFKTLLAVLLVEYQVTNQFAVPRPVPGVYARGLTCPGTNDRLYLVVIGDPAAAQYVVMGPATRGGAAERPATREITGNAHRA